MKTGYLITARLKSTRLPLKIVKKINDREIIRHMLDRLKLAKGVSNIIICTSTNHQDDPLRQIAIEEGVDYFLGSEEDVILRLYEAAKKFRLDYVVNITADCPLVSYEYVPIIIREYLKTKADLIRALNLPHGFFSYGINIEAMKRVCAIKDSSTTEIWGRYFTGTKFFKVVDLKIPDKHRRDYRLTLDYPEDYEFFKKVFEYFGRDTYKKSVDEIIDYLDRHPEIAAINRHCEEHFKKNFEEQDKIKIKAV